MAGLPMRIQYSIASIVYYIVYYVLRYRHRIVVENLKNSFPEKSETEIKRITKDFYRHFSDLFIESNALRGFSETELLKRCKFINPGVMDELYEQGKSVSVVLGHYGNWEYFASFQLAVKHKALAIYKPLKNKFFDEYMIRIRSKFGVQPVAMANIFRELVTYKNKGIPTATLFIADQSPHKQQIRFWADFLNQPTPVLLGTEKVAGKLNQAVVFFKMRKVKRGFYEVEVEKLFDDLSMVNERDITLRHMKVLEDLIKEQPEYWLWSHRRWKHKQALTN